MASRRWLIAGLAAILVLAAIGLRFWRVRRPPTPPAAKLPASARVLLQPFRKDNIDLTVAPQAVGTYKVGMKEGASMLYAWSTSPAEMLDSKFADRPANIAAEEHNAFVAQSSGWYRWNWKNTSSRSVTVHLKLSGYYETEP